jgi:fumarate hydratase, class II
MSSSRTQHDSLGPVEVPADALYGPQTARAVRNFPISGWAMPAPFLRALAQIKQAAAIENKQAGLLDEDIAEAIHAAANEVLDGKWSDQFPVDVFQTGSGTSSNMNMNEVLARRASQLLDRDGAVHPNDHVNLSQSSNDVLPTAIHVAAAVEIHDRLLPALRAAQQIIEAKADEFDAVVTIARTHLMDAVPITLGQQFSGFANQVEMMIVSAQQAMSDLCELPIGGTAVGTGLNCPPGFASDVCLYLAEENRLPFCEARNHFASAGCRNAALRASGSMRTIAISLGKIASDIRLLASGPRCGLGELALPALQPGSSIMPGKVNPVLCETVIQVACQVVGFDAAIAAGATGGVGSILQLNTAMPMIGASLIEQVQLLTNTVRVFADKCIAGIAANAGRCEELAERSLSLVTALALEIGYDAAAAIAHEAHETGRTIREVAREQTDLDEARLDALLDPAGQARPEGR